MAEERKQRTAAIRAENEAARAQQFIREQKEKEENAAKMRALREGNDRLRKETIEENAAKAVAAGSKSAPQALPKSLAGPTPMELDLQRATAEGVWDDDKEKAAFQKQLEYAEENNLERFRGSRQEGERAARAAVQCFTFLHKTTHPMGSAEYPRVADPWVAGSYRDRNWMGSQREKSLLVTNITRHGWFKPRGFGMDTADPLFRPDEEGWISVYRIVMEAKRTGPGHPLATVDGKWFCDIARNNDKSRFEVREQSNGVYDAIRAVQGHSRSTQKYINRDYLMSQVVTEAEARKAGWLKLFHGTGETQVTAILETGALLPGGTRGASYSRDVHFAPYSPGDVRIIGGMRFASEAMMEFDFIAMIRKGHQYRVSSNGVALSEIPVSTKYCLRACRLDTRMVIYHHMARQHANRSNPELGASSGSEAVYTAADGSAPIPGAAASSSSGSQRPVLPSAGNRRRGEDSDEVVHGAYTGEAPEKSGCPECSRWIIDGLLYCSFCQKRVVKLDAMSGAPE